MVRRFVALVTATQTHTGAISSCGRGYNFNDKLAGDAIGERYPNRLATNVGVVGLRTEIFVSSIMSATDF